MTEHRGTSFYNSCVKVPVDPYSRQPTPSYERPRLTKTARHEDGDTERKINFAKSDRFDNESTETSTPWDTLDNFLQFLESIPEYGQVNHLSNEQFKQKVDYLKRKQRMLLKNLRNSLDGPDLEDTTTLSVLKSEQTSRERSKNDVNELKLNGKKCYLEESRTSSPILFRCGTFSGLAEDQDLLSYRYKEKDKDLKTIRNRQIHSADRAWSTRQALNSDESLEDIDANSIETKSLPECNSKDWHPTVPKPFSFTLREEAEKYMNHVEKEAVQRTTSVDRTKSSSKKRRVRPIPLTSKIPLYDKLLAEKEERSRIIREESALNLMSQVRPFRLECDRRAWRSLARSSPEIRSSKSTCSSSRFKAKPVPKNLFGTEVYDRMLEDEYYRQLKKKVRAAELMKSSSLPPSMARRERVKSALANLRHTRDEFNEMPESEESTPYSNDCTTSLERSRSAITLLPTRGNNLAAILRCQASRQKLEREIRERMEEKRREQIMKMKESLIGRRPVWRALRSAARHEHERDLDIRASLRRDEAREQAERHRLQMEMMLNRVTRIPTLFERHSQSYQSLTKTQQKNGSKTASQRKKKKIKRTNSSSIDSYVSYACDSRPNSGSMTSSSGTLLSLSQSSKLSDDLGSRGSEKSIAKSESSFFKKKGDRGQLKVSIKETAELIEDRQESGKLSENECSSNEEPEENVERSNKREVIEE